MASNVAASVRARLANKARESKRPFQEVLQYYGLERFLYRLSCSQHRERFLLKGALMLRVWGSPASRPTRDIDFLAYADNDIPTLEAMMRDVCEVAVGPDGLKFDTSTMTGERIKEDAEYAGVRIKLVAFLENARIPIQIDVGFGDVVHPAPEEQEYPALLDLPTAQIRTYPRETVVAEKFHAMVFLGTLNSRMKDFFDVWLLARQFDFSGPQLAEAISKTFANRSTVPEPEPIALSAAFTAHTNTQKQWAAFIKRSNLERAPRTLDEIREPLRAFLQPVALALVERRAFDGHWSPPGPWTP